MEYVLDNTKVGHVTKQLRHSMFSSGKSLGSKAQLKAMCMCGNEMKLASAKYMCDKRMCKLSYDAAAVAFMLKNEYFHDPLNSPIRFCMCLTCSSSHLICPSNEKYFSCGEPKWTCSCSKNNRMYVSVLDSYKKDTDKMNLIWNVKALV
jgi:hypothetical protein